MSSFPLSNIYRGDHTQRWLKRMRQHETGLYKHSVHVAKLVTDYTRFCGLEVDIAWPMIEGGLLHDVGKILLPTAILVKAEALDKCEKKMIMLHPENGAHLLDAQDYYSETVIGIVRDHHERLDGSGYPSRLEGKRLSSAVRVVGVCDAFCALRERRPYEDAWPQEKALERLGSMKEQYDKTVVDTLRALVRERESGRRYKDTQVREPLDIVSKSQEHRRQKNYPLSAFYKAVYPPKSSSSPLGSSL